MLQVILPSVLDTIVRVTTDTQHQYDLSSIRDCPTNTNPAPNVGLSEKAGKAVVVLIVEFLYLVACLSSSD